MDTKVGDLRYVVGEGVANGHASEVSALLLDDQIKELENSIRHLERSNREILEEDPQLADEDFALAIEENKLVLEQKATRLEELRSQLKDIFPHGTDMRTVQEAIDVAQGKKEYSSEGFTL